MLTRPQEAMTVARRACRHNGKERIPVYIPHLGGFTCPIIAAILYNTERVDPQKAHSYSTRELDSIPKSLWKSTNINA